MRLEKIAGLSVLAVAICAGLMQQFAAPARAAAPVVRATYQGIGSGVNESVAILWLLGSDGGIKICTHTATSVTADAPVCSAPVVP